MSSYWTHWTAAGLNLICIWLADVDLIVNVSECNFLHPTFVLEELLWIWTLLVKRNTGSQIFGARDEAEESCSSSENVSTFYKRSVESNLVALKKKRERERERENIKLLLSTTGSALVGGSVIFQCWRGRRRLTELLSDSSSSSLSGLLRSFPPGMCGMDDKQHSQGIPHCQAAWRLLSFRRTRLCVWMCFHTGILFVLNKHIKTSGCSCIFLHLQRQTSFSLRLMEDEASAPSRPSVTIPQWKSLTN